MRKGRLRMLKRQTDWGVSAVAIEREESDHSDMPSSLNKVCRFISQLTNSRADLRMRSQHPHTI